jgi:multidrug efflux system membrane fusion protein
MMVEVRGRKTRKPLGVLLSVVLITAAAVLWVRASSSAAPSTDDASIDAEIVHVASPVGGRIVKLPVSENRLVQKGDLLFQIDPVPYQTNVAAAEAQLELAVAALASKQRLISTQKSNAAIADDQVARATANLALTQRTEKRLEPLSAKGYVPRQQLDQATVARQDAETTLQQALEGAHAGKVAVDSIADARATVKGASAALANARKALLDTQVFAPHDGRVTGLTVSTGEVVLPSQSLFTLIDTEKWFASANFRETDLSRIKPGYCVTVYSMIDRRRPVKGVVDGIGFGIVDDDRINIPRAVPYVQPSLNWVRVAHRFPVRIRLTNPPQDLVRVGASANVEVAHGAACR